VTLHRCLTTACATTFLFAVGISTSTSHAAGKALPSPQASGYLRALLNVNQALPAYAGFLGPEVLITDLEYVNGLNSPLKSYADAKAWLTAHYPSALVGVYCSSCAVQPANQQQSSPPNCLPLELFADSELLPPQFLNAGRRIVDYRQPSARSKLVAGIVNDAQLNQTQWLFADNWSHPSMFAGFIAWPDTINYMRELHSALATQGIGLICNVAIEPSSVPPADLAALGAACDGVSLEIYAPPAVTRDSKALARLVQGYQTLQAAGCRVILIPNFSRVDTGLAESRFAAGLAMILNGPWDSCPFFLPQQDWFRWPAQLGPPTSAIQQNGTRLWRYFLYGTIQINGLTRTITITWKRFAPPHAIRVSDRRLRQNARLLRFR
jgi:hypothetical protein